MIVGQVVVRPQGPGSNPHGGTLVAIVGIVTVPDDHPLAQKDGQQYAAAIETEGDPIDRSELARGFDLGDLLTQPIWRIRR